MPPVWAFSIMAREVEEWTKILPPRPKCQENKGPLQRRKNRQFASPSRESSASKGAPLGAHLIGKVLPCQEIIDLAEETSLLVRAFFHDSLGLGRRPALELLANRP